MISVDTPAALIIAAALSGLGIYLRSYIRKKAENLATKEDLSGITHTVEGIKAGYQLLLDENKPLTAEETLRREALLKSKMEAYYNALEVIYRKFASNDVRTADDTNTFLLPALEDRPTELEINEAFGRLVLYGGNRAILDKYVAMHATSLTPADIGEFLGLLRADVGSDALIPGAQFPYVFGTERRRSRVDDPDRKPL